MTESEALKFFKDFIEILRINGEEQIQKNDYRKASNIAIKALEKQIPKKPIIKQGKYCNAYHCPVCNGYIRSTNTRIEVILEENIFCGVCGQKLNWESDEE